MYYGCRVDSVGEGTLASAWGGVCGPENRTKGDASVPSPHPPNPRPYGTATPMWSFEYLKPLATIAVVQYDIVQQIFEDRG